MGRHHKPSTIGRRIAQAALVATAAPSGAALMGAGTASAAEDSTWDRLAQCESSGNWSINSGNGFSGGLQFTASTWRAFGGTQYAPNAWQASRVQQIAVAERVLKGQGWGAWPACTKKLGISGRAELRSVPAPAPRAAAPTAKAAPAPAATTVGRVWPLRSHAITSGFGQRWGTAHQGIDMPAPIGTPIYAAHAGEVISSGPASGFGLWVRVRAADGTITVYGHINRSLVRVGQQVRAGQQIAEVGNRGQSTGPHLHFEVWVGGKPINPVGWLRNAKAPGEKATTQKNKIVSPAPKAPATPKAVQVAPKPAPSGAPAGARFTPGGDGEYTVKLGDTLSHLAKVNGTSVTRLMELNTDIIEMPDWIFEGEKIHLR